jgi:hypothetical protein
MGFFSGFMGALKSVEHAVVAEAKAVVAAVERAFSDPAAQSGLAPLGTLIPHASNKVKLVHQAAGKAFGSAAPSSAVMQCQINTANAPGNAAFTTSNNIVSKQNTTKAAPPQKNLPANVIDAIRLVNPQLATSGVYHSDGYVYPLNMPAGEAAEACAVLVETLRPGVGKTDTWAGKKGPDILATDGTYPVIEPGTPVATFKDGAYPHDGIYDPGATGLSKYAHSAVFLGYIYGTAGQISGMTLLDQYDGQPARISTRSLPTSKTYSVIKAQVSD